MAAADDTASFCAPSMQAKLHVSAGCALPSSAAGTRSISVTPSGWHVSTWGPVSSAAVSPFAATAIFLEPPQHRPALHAGRVATPSASVAASQANPTAPGSGSGCSSRA